MALVQIIWLCYITGVDWDDLTMLRLLEVTKELAEKVKEYILSSPASGVLLKLVKIAKTSSYYASYPSPSLRELSATCCAIFRVPY